MGEQTPKDLFTRWDSSEITDEEALGQSIQSLVQLEDRVDAHDLKVENLIEQQRKEIYALKKKLEQQEIILKAQVEVSQTQDTVLKGQRKALRALRAAYETDFERLNRLIRRMIKPVEMAESFFLEMGKIAAAIQRIGKFTRQFLDMRKDDS